MSTITDTDEGSTTTDVYETIPVDQFDENYDLPPPPPLQERKSILILDNEQLPVPSSPLPDDVPSKTHNITLDQALEQVSMTVSLPTPNATKTATLQPTAQQSFLYKADDDVKLADRHNYPCSTHTELFSQESESRAIFVSTIPRALTFYDIS